MGTRLAAAALFAIMSLSPLPASAGDAASASEILVRARAAGARHARRLRALEEKIHAQTYDPDAALMERNRIEREYRNELRALQDEERRAPRTVPARDYATHGASSAEARAVPAIPSQSRIVFPGSASSDETPIEERPSRHGRQENVGVGVRELDF